MLFGAARGRLLCASAKGLDRSPSERGSPLVVLELPRPAGITRYEFTSVSRSASVSKDAIDKAEGDEVLLVVARAVTVASLGIYSVQQTAK